MSLAVDLRLVNNSCLISFFCKLHMTNIGNIICQAEVTISSLERHPVGGCLLNFNRSQTIISERIAVM